MGFFKVQFLKNGVFQSPVSQKLDSFVLFWHRASLGWVWWPVKSSILLNHYKGKNFNLFFIYLLCSHLMAVHHFHLTCKVWGAMLQVDTIEGQSSMYCPSQYFGMVSWYFYYLAPGGGCKVLFSPGLCVCLCPANILVFYFSDIKRYRSEIYTGYLWGCTRFTNKIDLHRVKVIGTVHCFLKVVLKLSHRKISNFCIDPS